MQLSVLPRTILVLCVLIFVSYTLLNSRNRVTALPGSATWDYGNQEAASEPSFDSNGDRFNVKGDVRPALDLFNDIQASPPPPEMHHEALPGGGFPKDNLDPYLMPGSTDPNAPSVSLQKLPQPVVVGNTPQDHGFEDVKAPHSFADIAHKHADDQSHIDIHTKYLEPIRFTNFKFLKVGLNCNMKTGPGPAYGTIREYLPRAELSYIDGDIACTNAWASATLTAKTINGDLSDARFVERFMLEHRQKFQVVEGTIVEFKILFETVVIGGVYLCIDDGKEAMKQFVINLLDDMSSTEILSVDCMHGACAFTKKVVETGPAKIDKPAIGHGSDAEAEPVALSVIDSQVEASSTPAEVAAPLVATPVVVIAPVITADQIADASSVDVADPVDAMPLGDSIVPKVTAAPVAAAEGYRGDIKPAKLGKPSDVKVVGVVDFNPDGTTRFGHPENYQGPPMKGSLAGFNGDMPSPQSTKSSLGYQ